MSYKDKLQNYQADCYVEIGRFKNFSDYIKEFACKIPTNRSGLDIGAGPGGYNGKYFEHCKAIDGCDADPDVVATLPDVYNKVFRHSFGQNLLPYEDNKLDFVILSCVIQHLNNFNELTFGIKEISRVLSKGGRLYLMFKAGSNDTELTHFNNYYKQTRTFRVFHPDRIVELCSANDLYASSSEKLVDEHWISYVCFSFVKL